MQLVTDYFCAYCGESNTTFVDLTSGMSQNYIEDCQVCCRPNLLYISIDEDTLEVEISSDYQE